MKAVSGDRWRKTNNAPAWQATFHPPCVTLEVVQVHLQHLCRPFSRGDFEVPPVENIYRHRLPVRLTHRLNVVCLPILVMSGRQIFNAHQALYWGERSDPDRSLLSIKAINIEDGELKGITTVLGHAFETTGVLGFSSGAVRGFPSRMTIPSGKWLAMGRQRHFFFAWVFVVNGVFFALYALVSRHLRETSFQNSRIFAGSPVNLSIT